MKFVATRALRINPGGVWSLLQEEKDLVITSNGKPVGVLTVADEDNLEDVLTTLRQARAQAAVADIRRLAVARGLDRLTDRPVRNIIQASRKGAKARRPRAVDHRGR
jgi:PHD/YefM family antitoxin component YafN of YafNO toxin-antitoxin module